MDGTVWHIKRMEAACRPCGKVHLRCNSKTLLIGYENARLHKKVQTDHTEKVIGAMVQAADKN